MFTIKSKVGPDLQQITNEHKEIIREHGGGDEGAKKAVADLSHLLTFLPFMVVAENLQVYIPLFLSSADLKAVLIIDVSTCTAFYDPERQDAC